MTDADFEARIQALHIKAERARVELAKARMVFEGICNDMALLRAERQEEYLRATTEGREN